MCLLPIFMFSLEKCLLSFSDILTGLSASKWTFQGEGTFPLLQVLPEMEVLSWFLFPFTLPSYMMIFLATLDIWDLLAPFSRCSVKIVPWRVRVKVAQSCPTFCDPMDYTVHGIIQARLLEWVAIPSSRGSSQPRDWTQVSCIAGGFFTNCGWACGCIFDVFVGGGEVHTLLFCHLDLALLGSSYITHTQHFWLKLYW